MYNEFLKRFYSSLETNVKLTKILFFYEKYSKIYANYTVIPESKYMNTMDTTIPMKICQIQFFLLV